MYNNETIARVIPLDGNYMLQRYRPDYDDWVNWAIYDDEQCAMRRASKYAPPPPTKGTDDDTHQQQTTA